jgi:hypothetical protein
MSDDRRLERLDRREREELCREVLAQLSEYVEGAADEDFCDRVEELLDGCQPFQAYCNTLKATIDLARDCDQPPDDWDDVFERSVAAIRERLRG